MIRSFKSACTKQFNEMNLDWLGWQPRFHDHIIIKNNEELYRICQYIRNNPLNWTDDENNPENIKT